MTEQILSRRHFLRLASGIGATALLAACQPKVVEKIVKETVVVKEEVEKPVTQVVEKEVTKVVEKEKVVKETVVVEKISEPVEIRATYSLSPETTNAAMEFMADWREKTNIRIIKYEGGVGGTEAMLAAIVAGTAPDIMSNFGPGLRQYIEREVCLNLSPFIDRDYVQDMKDFLEPQLKVSQWKGSQYGIPLYTGIYGGYYNKDLFDAAQLPYPTADLKPDDWVTIGQKLTKKDDNGIPVEFGLGLMPWMGFDIATVIWSWGGEVHDPNDNRICLMDQPPALEALQWMWDLRWKYNVTGQPSQLTALNTWSGGFESGKIGYAQNGSWAMTGWIAAIGANFNWDCLPTFQGPTGNRWTFSTTDTWVVNSKTKAPEAAWTVLKLFTSPEYERFQMADLWQPARKSLIPEFEGILKEKAVKANPASEKISFKPFFDGYQWARPMVYFAKDSEANEILGPVLDQIFTLGTVKPEEVLPAAVKKVNEIMAKED